MAYKKIIGIYKITSPTGKIYIGQSVNIYKRWADYRSLCNCKQQGKLYNSFLKYGVKEHKFEIVCNCSTTKECNEMEIYYGKLYNVTDKNIGLNIRDCGGSKGSLSNETIEKIRKANKGRKLTEEIKRKISLRQIGRKTWNKGLKGVQNAWNKGLKMPKSMRDKLSILKKGKKLSDEHKKKISDKLKGRLKTKEHLKKIGDSNKGRKFSEQTLLKMSKSHIGKKLTDEQKKKISIFNKGRKHSIESKKKMSASQKGKIISIEARKKMSLSAKGRKHTEQTKKKIANTLLQNNIKKLIIL